MLCLMHFSLNLSRAKAVHYSFLAWVMSSSKYHHQKHCWIFQSTYFLSLYIVLVTPPVDKNENYFPLVFLWGVLIEEWSDNQCYIILPTKRFYVAVCKFRNWSQITPKYCKNKKSGIEGAAKCVRCSNHNLVSFVTKTKQIHSNIKPICFI